MRSGVKDRKPPYAEPLVRWCERSVNTKVGDKHLRLVFTSYSISTSLFPYPCPDLCNCNIGSSILLRLLIISFLLFVR